MSPWPLQLADGSAPLRRGEGLGVRFLGVRPPEPELFLEDEAGSEHLPKRLDGERLEAGTAGGSPQRGVEPPLWWSLRSTASMRLWPTSRRSPSRLRLPAAPKPKMWSVSCLRRDLHRGNLHRDVDEPAESCTPVQGAQW